MRHLLISLACAIGLAHAAFAGPTEDAAYIVEQHLYWNDYDAGAAALQREIFANIEQALGQFGATVIDPERFIEEMFGGLKEVVRAETIKSYRAAMSDAALAELAEFYRTDLGQATLSSGVAPGRATYLAVMQYHAEAGAHLEQAIPSALEQFFSLQRQADILEMPDIVAFENEADRSKVVAAMRGN